MLTMVLPKALYRLPEVKVLREEVVPTYKKLYDFMQQEYLPKSRTTSGISGIKGGDDYYRFLVRYWTCPLGKVFPGDGHKPVHPTHLPAPLLPQYDRNDRV